MTGIDRMIRDSMDQVEQIQTAFAAERGRVFERVSESGLCRVSVGLDGNLCGVVFFRNDVFGIEETSMVAAEVLTAIKAARADAAVEAARIVDRFVPSSARE
ncbi:hypothetical protein [Glycomyces sp. NRRL B-16210]|uniref:hypothetical protein n=1 Tax=Glycomyces sp. NRRL B-16210 TaxID=1463821 RepID=UPI0004C260DF|nr:hypothetical protein [Glycomyces sp. NRRL B-16210]